MAKIRNVSGEDRTITGGRLVLAGQVIEVPDDEVEAYTCQTVNWAPAKATTKNKAGDAGEEG